MRNNSAGDSRKSEINDGRLCSGANVELFKNVRQMVSYGERTQFEFASDFLIGKAPGKQAKDFVLPIAQ